MDSRMGLWGAFVQWDSKDKLSPAHPGYQVSAWGLESGHLPSESGSRTPYSASY